MSTDWSQLLSGLLGLTGSGLSLAGLVQQQGRQNTLWDESQDLYKQLLNLTNQQQGRLDTQYQQEQDDYQKQQQQASIQSERQNQYWGETQDDWIQRKRETAQDRANLQQTYDARSAIGATLADTDKVKAGAHALYDDMSQASKDQILRSAATSAASRGLTPGAAASLVVEQAYAPYELQQRQNAYNNYLNSQNAALNAYQYAPHGSLNTQDPTAPPGQVPFQNTRNVPNQANYGPASNLLSGGGNSGSSGQQSIQDVLKQLGNLIGGTGGGAGIVKLLQQLFSGSGSGDAQDLTQAGGDITKVGASTGEGDPSGSNTQTDPSVVQDLQQAINQIPSGGGATSTDTGSDLLFTEQQ